MQQDSGGETDTAFLIPDESLAGGSAAIGRHQKEPADHDGNHSAGSGS